MKKKLVCKPFFTDAELKDKVEVSNKDDADCEKCGLYRLCKSPKMPATGKGGKSVLIIAEAPGKTESEQNQQLVGDAGKYLRKLLKRRGFDLDKDFRKTNAVICRPFTVDSKGNESNRKPKKAELQLCRKHYLKEIEQFKPKFIWLMGGAAIESYLPARFKDEDGKYTPTRWRGLCIPDVEADAWVIPLFHPSYAMRFEHDPLVTSQFERDLDFALSCLDLIEVPKENPYENVKVLTDFFEIKDFLCDLYENPPEYLTFDYETTGLKPFNNGHKIACMSMCFGDTAYSFPVQHPCLSEDKQNIIVDCVKKILEGSSKKIAQGLKYEDVWSRVILKANPANWHWCTMNASHCIDNRRGFTGLKFQAFTRWGIANYSNAVDQYLKPKKGERFNKVMEAPLDELLLYNAVDSLLTHRLFLEQREELDGKWKDGYNFFLDGALALADVQITGINADRKYYEETDKLLGDKLSAIESRLKESDEYNLFLKSKGKPINFNSDKDLRELFFDLMKLPVTKTTEGNQPSVDAETLMSLDSSIARDLIEMSKTDKIKGTYMGQFLREIDDDNRIHPFFNLHLVNTFRSSSSNPNFQNIPVRDPIAKKYTRSGILPSKGNILLDWDYGALEVRIIACATQDPVLVDYCTRDGSDMHRDLASRLFKLDLNNVSKKLRFHGKNGATFPWFYGSYYKNVAKNVWLACEKEQLKTEEGQDIFEYMLEQRIIKRRDHFDGFVSHVKTVEDEFWSTFRATKAWQEKQFDFYLKHGYVETLTGFKCSGYMTRNKCVNYPIQGSAFHCLLYSLIHIHNYILDHNLLSKILGQIHDCLLFDVYPKERDRIVAISHKIACEQIRKEWKWIIVPLTIEVEETEIDGSWHSKVETREENGFFDLGEEDEE